MPQVVAMARPADPIQFERQAAAGEVAALLIRGFGSPDAAEAVLECLIEREAPDTTRDFWAEVIIAIAQVRG